MSGFPVFISGTDTGIGKTTVGRLLVEGLVARDLRTAVAKPVETGAPVGAGGVLMPEDASKLLNASNVNRELDEVCFHSFVEPVAPSVAFEQAGEVPNIMDWQDRVASLSERSDLVLVEGAGGIMVPILGEYTFLDFLKDAQWPVLLVVGSKLGAINHFSLTLEALSKNGVPVLGYVVNELFSGSEDFEQYKLAHQTNKEQFGMVAARYGVPEIHCLPFLSDDSSSLASHREALALNFLARCRDVFGCESLGRDNVA